jgi:hypothetical protein
MGKEMIFDDLMCKFCLCMEIGSEWQGRKYRGPICPKCGPNGILIEKKDYFK